MIPSLPLWERGLKFENMKSKDFESSVAPPVGAWIEIEMRLGIYHDLTVAPPVGAWIEIYCCVHDGLRKGSLPLWERGLKLDDYFTNYKAFDRSLPLWERGLKY